MEIGAGGRSSDIELGQADEDAPASPQRLHEFPLGIGQFMAACHTPVIHNPSVAVAGVMDGTATRAPSPCPFTDSGNGHLTFDTCRAQNRGPTHLRRPSEGVRIRRVCASATRCNAPGPCRSWRPKGPGTVLISLARRAQSVPGVPASGGRGEGQPQLTRTGPRRPWGATRVLVRFEGSPPTAPRPPGRPGPHYGEDHTCPRCSRAVCRGPAVSDTGIPWDHSQEEVSIVTHGTSLVIEKMSCEKQAAVTAGQQGYAVAPSAFSNAARVK